MNTSTKVLISSVGFAKDKLFVELSTGRVLVVPHSYTKRLANAREEELKDRLVGNR